MSIVRLAGGSCFGTHRVLDPVGVLPQPAYKLDNRMDRLWETELLVDVDTLNVDSASFAQIKKQAGGDEKRIGQIILNIVSERGKLQNPVTGSGGMFTGRVAALGDSLTDRGLKPGDRIASLVSLSLTPLLIERILEVREATDQVDIKGRAVIFESGLYALLPDDIPLRLALAALDVCGAPAQASRLCREDDVVVILGATGKSGVLCAHAVRKKIRERGRLIGLGRSKNKLARLEQLGLYNELINADATDALQCRELVYRLTKGRMADLVINCVNVPDTEMASILMCRDGGVIYFFSMATSFTKAALGAEGVGRDVEMIIGNGYTRGHADLTLGILRESEPIRELFEELFC